MKRLIAKTAFAALVLGAVTAAAPSAGAIEGSIGGGGSTECPRPSAGWEINVMPPDVRVYADPGKICIAT